MTAATTDPAASAHAGAAAWPIDLAYYTDPLCCWSWGFEPVWRRFLAERGERMRVRYVMGGMVRDWSSYNDPLNSVSRPIQMGPLCVQVREMAGVEVNDRVWVESPPASSFPACLAVKAAGLQSLEAEGAMLGRLREALFREGRDVARRTELVAAARLVTKTIRGFDAERFTSDLDSDAAADAFRDDLKLARYHEIGRFPTLTLHAPSAPRGIRITGYRPLEVLQAAVEEITTGGRG